jgi:hypothetical protein
MHQSLAPAHKTIDITSYYLSGVTMRSRSVSDLIPTAVLNFPAPTIRLLADWEREITTQLCLEPGDVEALSLARTRARWPDYKHCVQAISDWTRALGLTDILQSSEVAIMACRGARYHHDGAQYGSSAFCNLFLSDDKSLDLHFPSTGRRIPLTRGTAVIFDTCQPHAVIRRSGPASFDEAHFKPTLDCSQLFLTWELSVENTDVTKLLGIRFDTNPSPSSELSTGQVWFNNLPAMVCPASGRWIPTDETSEN